jgi:cytochrome c oxidase cbb3-type subunit III
MSWPNSGSTRKRILREPLCIAVMLALSPWNVEAQQLASRTSQTERGHKQFQQACGFCHGADATGARGPDLVRSPLVAHDVNGDLIGDVIRHGRPDQGMPAMEMTNEQIADISSYLHARIAESTASSRIPRSYPREKLLTGNIEAGKAYFNGAGGCANCHSPTGDLAGIGAKYSPVDLQARMLYPEGNHKSAIVTLASGEQVKGKVVHADDFVMAVRDAAGWYRSFRRDRVRVEVHDALEDHRKLLDKITPTQMHDLFAYVESLK